MSEIDSLEIQVKSDAKSTFSALEELEKKLSGISKTLSEIGNCEGLKQVSNLKSRSNYTHV